MRKNTPGCLKESYTFGHHRLLCNVFVMRKTKHCLTYITGVLLTFWSLEGGIFFLPM